MSKKKKYKPKLVRHMAEFLKYDSESGKPVLTEAPLYSPACLSSSKHLALASTSVTMQGRLFLLSLFFLPSVLLLDPDQTLSTSRCLWRSLSSQVISYSISPVSVKGLDHVSLLSTQLPHFSRI